MKIINRKRTRHFFSGLFLAIVLVISSAPMLQAADLGVKNTMRLFWMKDATTLQEIPYDVKLDDVQVGSTLHVQMDVEPLGGALAHVGISQLSGITFLSFAQSNFKLNNQSESLSNYQKFTTTQGMNINATLKNKVEFDVKYTGAIHNNISIATLVNEGGQSFTQSFKFESSFTNAKFYQVHFYDGNQLISKQTLPENEKAYIPSVEREGSVLKGFNRSQEGTGSFYKGEGITQNETLYAMFEKQTFQVSYFIGKTLYATRKVAYGENASDIIPTIQSNHVFMGWDKSLVGIKNDISVFGVFQKLSEESIHTKTDSLLILKFENNGSSKIETNKNQLLRMNEYGELVEAKSLSFSEEVQNFFRMHGDVFPFLLIFILILLLIVCLYIRKRRIEKRNRMKVEAKEI